MKQIIFTYLIFFLFLNLAFSQERPNRGCATDEYMELLKQQDPNLEAKEIIYKQELAKWIKEYRADKKNKRNTEDEILVIPTVVHVIWNTPQQNISLAQVQSQIESINADLRKLNADNANLPAEFSVISADLEIELCLALRDPNDNLSNGVTRTETDIVEFTIEDSFMKQTATGGHDPWDNQSYLNIWVCNIGGGILGYSTLPPSHGQAADGIVVGTGTFGKGDAYPLIAPYNLGRTLSHEFGHWLGLYHVWGNNGGCGDDDGITDTPNQEAQYNGDPVHPQVSCGSNDMFQNYMDYVNDFSMVSYTEGQKEVMRASLLNQRASILSSDGCLGTGNVEADFTATNPPPNATNTEVVVLIGAGGVTFGEICVQDNSNPILSFQWTFEGASNMTSYSGTVANPNPPIPISYIGEGTYDVTLTITAQNGTIITITKEDYVNIAYPLAIPKFIANNDITLTEVSILTGETVFFTDNSDASLNPLVYWKWEFEGGEPAEWIGKYPPEIRYNEENEAGYRVKLTIAESEDGTLHPASATFIGFVKVHYIPSTTDFSAHPLELKTHKIVYFSDATIGASYQHRWEFPGGDPETSTEENPIVYYHEMGVYDVRLTIYDGHLDRPTKEKAMYIVVNPDPPIADFTHTADGAGFAIVGQLLDFTDLTMGGDTAPDIWQWEFEGATPSISNKQNPESIFFPEIGKYPVKLTVTDLLDSVSTYLDTVVIENGQYFGQNFNYNCDEISNIEQEEETEVIRTTYPFGWVSGHNEREITTFIDAYKNEIEEEFYMYGLDVGVFKAYATKPNYRSRVDFQIYDKDTNVIKSQRVNLIHLSEGVYNPIYFDTPVLISDDFFIGYEISYAEEDTFAVYMAKNRGKIGRNTVYVKKNGMKWTSIDDVFSGSLLGSQDTLKHLRSSLAIDPIACITAINEVNADKHKIYIYPNPARDKVNIKIEKKEIEEIDIKCFDILGRTIDIDIINSFGNNYEADFSNCKNGFYFIKINRSGKEYIKKISIQR